MVFWSIGFGARTIYVAKSKEMVYAGYSYLSYENVETVNEKSVLNMCFYKKDELILGHSVRKAPYRKQGSHFFYPFDSLLSYDVVAAPKENEKEYDKESFYSLLLWILRYIKKNHDIKDDDCVNLVTPDYFDDAKRTLLLQAAESVGMPQPRLCYESFAISFSNQHFGQMTQNNTAQCVAYIDMGASHSTIHTVACGNLKNTNGKEEKQFILVDSTSIDTVCGSRVDDFIHEIVREKLEELSKKDAIKEEMEEESVTLDDLKSARCLFDNRKEIESMKSAFSNSAVDEAGCEINWGNFTCQLEVKESEVRNKLQPLVTALTTFLEEWKKNIMKKLEQVKSDVTIPSNITRVEIVGGCSRLCIFKSRVESFVKENSDIFSCKNVSYTLNLEYGVDGAILTEMASNQCNGFEERAHFVMKMVNPHNLYVSAVQKVNNGLEYRKKPCLTKNKLRELNIERNSKQCLQNMTVIKGHPIMVENEDGSVLCYFLFENTNGISEEEEVEIEICVDASDVLHCFMGDQELAKHHVGLPQRYYSLEGSVQKEQQQLHDLIGPNEGEVPPHAIKGELFKGKEPSMLEGKEPSMLVRSLYNLLEQDFFEGKRRNVSSMRNDIDVFTTKTRNEGVDLSPIQDEFGTIRSKFFNGKIEQTVVDDTVKKLTDLKEKAGEKKLCEFLDGVIERVKKIGAEYVFIKNPDKVEAKKEPKRN